MERLKKMLVSAFVCAIATTVVCPVFAMEHELVSEESAHPELLALINDLVKRPSVQGSTQQEQQPRENNLEHEKEKNLIETSPGVVRRCSSAVLNNKLTTMATIGGAGIGYVGAVLNFAPIQGLVFCAVLGGASLALPTWLTIKLCECLCCPKKKKRF